MGSLSKDTIITILQTDTCLTTLSEQVLKINIPVPVTECKFQL